MRDNNLYELLQVIPTADAEVIQAAYRRLILRYHPDRSNEPNAAEMTQRLNGAYAILSDPTRKEEYDRELRGRASSSSSGTGQTSSRTSQSRPNTPPPPPKTRPPSRAPRRTRVDCPHCKQSVIPTKVGAFDWITFYVLSLLARRPQVKDGMCSNCGKALPANLLGAKRRFSATIKTTKYGD